MVDQACKHDILHSKPVLTLGQKCFKKKKIHRNNHYPFLTPVIMLLCTKYNSRIKIKFKWNTLQ